MGTAKNFFVYILASRRNGTLYTGMTADLPGRVYTHREDLIAGLTRRHGVHVLVWYEWVEFAEPAIRRENRSRNGAEHGSSS